MGILREIRAIPEALRGLTKAIVDVSDVMDAAGPGDARLEELERGRAMWEAEIEAMILKAESQYKAAASSESRARTMEKNAKALADPFAEEGEERPEGIPPEYVGVGQGEALQPVHPGVETLTPKQQALRFKFS